MTPYRHWKKRDLIEELQKLCNFRKFLEDTKKIWGRFRDKWQRGELSYTKRQIKWLEEELKERGVKNEISI